MEADPDDALALLRSASLGGVVALGALGAGCGGRRHHLQAGVVVPARDREGLERLARYVLGPPMGKDRLELRGDRVAVRLKRE